MGFEPNRPRRNGNAGVGLSHLRELASRLLRRRWRITFTAASTAYERSPRSIISARAIRADSDRAEHGVIWRTCNSSFGSIVPVVASPPPLDVFTLSATWSRGIGEEVELIYRRVASAMEETKTFDVAIFLFFFAGCTWRCLWA